MDDLLELRFRVLELSYKYDKKIEEVLKDFLSINVAPAPKGGKKKGGRAS